VGSVCSAWRCSHSHHPWRAQERSCPDERIITGDRVEYIDYETDTFKHHPSAVGFELEFHKAKFFEYEAEFRMVLYFNEDVREVVLAEHPNRPSAITKA
jgi:hypothetical protein